MVSKWKALSPKEKLQYKIVLIFLIAGFYGLLFYPSTHANFFEAKKMLNRKKNRVELHSKSVNLGDNTLSPKTIQKKIKKTELEIQKISTTFDELDTGFAPLESSVVQQQLLLEVTKLAERTGITLISVAKKGYTQKSQKSISPVDPVLGRPLLLVKASSSYFSFLEFLDGLKYLSFYVSVMNLNIHSGSNGQLSLSLELSI